MTATLANPYNPAWPQWFGIVRSRIEPQLADVAHDIEHVGSMAISGMTAKPIIDIDIVVARVDFAVVQERLATLGYVHQGDLGIPDREAFDLADAEAKRSLSAHHLYVCMTGAAELRKHLTFRDFLRQHPEWVRRLSDLKVLLCERSGNDRPAYMDGKTEMMQQIAELAKRSVESAPER